MNPESSNRSLILVGIVVVLIIAGAAYSFTRTGSGTTATSTATSTLNLSDLDLSTISTTTVINTAGGSYTITPVTDNAPTPPNYKKPVAFNASVEENVRAAINAQLKQTQDVIAKDQFNFEAWVNLGILHKMGGDYEGAADIWRYVAAIYPKSTVPLDDLGGLYMDFLKNYAKAEANFKASIALDPHDVHAYDALVSLYTTYGYKTKAAALALLEQGLAANPNNATLLQLKAQLNAQ